MLKLLRNMRWQEWVLILISICFIVVQVQLELMLPDYMSEITTLVETEGSEMSEVLAAGGKMLLCALGSLAAAIIVGFLAAQVSARFSRSLRGDIYNKVMSFSDEEINHFSTASLITRSTNDITQVQMFIAMGLQVIVRAPIMGGMAIYKISSKGWQWSLLTGCVVVFICVVMVCLMIYAVPRFRRIQWLTDDLNRVTRENLTGLLVVRAHNAEDYQEKKFADVNETLTRTNLQANRALATMNPALNLAMNGLTLGIYWIGAFMISGVALTSAEAVAERIEIFSNMVVFMNYAMQVVMAFLMLVMVFIMLPRVLVAARRISDVLTTDLHIQNGTQSEGKEDMRGEVEFRDVSFRYPDAGGDVIHHISFTAHQGETVALIGATGSGKSTIINLIPRMYDATDGQVFVDGRDVREYDQAALHKKIGFVPQKSFLFSGTVADNVGYGEDELDDEEMQRAVAIAQATEFVESDDCGYDGTVAQTGSNFSGGQKQRLAIARAVATRPEILVFDDSFSALDYKTDRAVRSAINKETDGVTNIIVAQRIGTIRDADRILVIEDGEIVGNGTHNELMKNCPLYQEIAYSQLSKEELES